MKHNLVTGIIVAVVAALVAAFGGSIGITTVWPVLLAVAVGLASGVPTPGKVIGYLAGAVVSIATLGARAALFPDVASARAGAVVVAVALIVLIAVVSGGRAPMAAGLAGYAAFAALYEPVFADNPTGFLTDAPVALLVIAIGAGIGVLAVQVPALLTGGFAGDTNVYDEAATAQGGSF
jgi:hypothetical protein